MVGDGRLNGVGPILAALLLVGLVSCEAPRSTAPDPANTSEPADVAPREAIATMQDIVADPVSVARGQAPPAPAVIGQGLAYGDQIRTEGTALAEAKLVTGPVFRIGGNAVLTLRPNQQLQLDAGQMITWVEGQPPGPVEIVTPVGIAGLRGTTAFVNIAEDPQAPIEIFPGKERFPFGPRALRKTSSSPVASSCLCRWMTPICKTSRHCAIGCSPSIKPQPANA